VKGKKVHLIIDAPHWRTAEVRPMEVNLSEEGITIEYPDDHILIRRNGEPVIRFSLTTYDVFFAADHQVSHYMNRENDLVVKCG
jgi:hypothetical protein